MGQWGKHVKKNVTLCFHILFWYIFIVFHHKICVFIIFIHEVLNFCKRILTNQKHELVTSNCINNYVKWSCFGVTFRFKNVFHQFCINIIYNLKYMLFYRQHFYDQHQAEIDKKLSKSYATP